MPRIAVIGNPGAWSSESLADAVAARTGERWLVDPAKLVCDLACGTVRAGGLDLATCDAIMIKKLGEGYSAEHLDRLELLRLVHERGVPVFSQPLRIARILDRLTCTVTLRLNDIPMPPTTICERVDDAVAAVEGYGRAVLKPLFSSKARGMKVVSAGPEARGVIERFQAENAILYIQQMIDLPGRDLGVAFLGGEYLATYARVGRGDSWNTTTRSGGKYAAQEIGPDLIEFARRAQAPFGLDFTCVDVAETADGPIVFEVSAFGGFRGLADAHQMNIGEKLVEYVMGKIGA